MKLIETKEEKAKPKKKSSKKTMKLEFLNGEKMVIKSDTSVYFDAIIETLRTKIKAMKKD